MREFVRALLRILDRSTKRRLAIASVGSVLLAGLEALGLALIGPLVLVVNAAAGDQATVPPSARWAADLFRSSTPTRLATFLGIAVVLAFVVKGVLAVVLLRWNFGVVLEAEAETSARLFRAYLLAPWTFHLERNSAELQRTVHDGVRRVFENSTAALVGAIADVAVLTGVALLITVNDPVVAIVVIGYFSVIAVGYQRLIHGRAETAGAEIHDEVRHAYQTVQQGVRSAKHLMLSHRQEQFVHELRTTKLQMASGMRTLLLGAQLPRYYLEIALVLGVGFMSALLFGTRPPGEALATLGFFLAAGFRLLPSLNRILVAASSARSDLPAIRSIVADLGRLGGTRSSPVPAAPLSPGPIALDQVGFTYPGASVPALRGISLKIAPGESIGFIGESGSGKTTLLDLLLGLLPPSEGSIAVGGVPLDEVCEAFQRSVGYVPQDVGLVDDTLLANIAFACAPAEVDHDRVGEAVRLAQLEDLVTSLPRGLATMIGEDGTRLSGGQRQRVGIARALYNAPTLLVLDEATSALDSVTETRITSTIEQLRGALTIVVVAHRLSTIRGCDRLFLLRHGRLAATGTFESLAATSAEFREYLRLADVQSNGHPTAATGHPPSDPAWSLG